MKITPETIAIANAELAGYPEVGKFELQLTSATKLVVTRVEVCEWKKNRHYPVAKSVSYEAALRSNSGDMVKTLLIKGRRGNWLQALVDLVFVEFPEIAAEMI